MCLQVEPGTWGTCVSLYSIQVLRALAAWSLVFHHYCMIFAVAEPSWWRRGFLVHGSAGVDVFFVVSGLVMGLSASDPTIGPRVFLAKRLGRIVPAYWLFTLVVAALIVWAPHTMERQGYSAAFLVKSLLFIPAQNPSGIGLFPVNTVGWTLNYEMVFYAVVGASLLAKLPQRSLWIVIGIVVLQHVLVPLGVMSPFYSSPLLYEFLMGIVAAHLWRAGVLRGRAWLFGCPALLAILCILRSSAGSPMRALDWGVPSFLLVCAFLGLERYFKRAVLLKHLGDHSYSVYLIHPTILYLGWYAYRTTGGSYALISVGAVAAIALIGAGGYRFIEQPVGRWLTQRLLPRRKRTPARPAL